ncbi:hypothetical protein, partial [Acetobacter indonesiensis]
MSRYLNSNDFQEIEILISNVRLKKFIDLTKSKTKEDGIELHQASMTLGASVMAVTSIIEVAIRNASCNEIDKFFNVNNWLYVNPKNFNWASSEYKAIRKAIENFQREEYGKKSVSEKVALDSLAYPNGIPAGTKEKDKNIERQKNILYNNCDIISYLTMNFWKKIFAENYENKLWKPALKNVFPNKSLDRNFIYENISNIHEIRNRLAHHEPVFGTRLNKILNSIDFIKHNMLSSTEN